MSTIKDSSLTSSMVKGTETPKSKLFLYPLLQLPKTHPNPLGTFLYTNPENKIYEDRYLYLWYHISQKNYTKLKEDLLNHDLFDFLIEDEDGFVLFIMTFEQHKETFDLILNGQYHKIVNPYKLILELLENPVVSLALNPKLFHKQLINELRVSEEELPLGTQVIDRPNKQKETLMISPEIWNKIMTIRNN